MAMSSLPNRITRSYCVSRRCNELQFFDFESKIEIILNLFYVDVT
jgi:hypothetical protein